MAIVAGLGNPGEEYAGSRHNIGFELIDRIAEDLSLRFRTTGESWLLAEGNFKGSPLRLVKPLTFMNRSGEAFRRAVNRFGPPLDRCLVCYDDINLQPGTIRMRPGGSAGGHNGLTDIISRMGTDRIPRLRIGIGNNFERGRQSEYVLSGFTPEERIVMDETIPRAVDAVLTFVRDGIELAMNQFN